MFKKMAQWLGVGGGDSKETRGVAAKPLAAAVIEMADRAWACEDFDSIEASGSVRVEWTRGAPGCVSVAAKNDLDHGMLSCAVEGGSLRVSVGEGSQAMARFSVSSSSLRSFRCVGAAQGAARGVDAEVFVAELDQGGALAIEGVAVAARLRIAGSGSLDADGLRAHTVMAAVAGPGTLTAHAESVAKVSISGGGEAMVYGNPSISEVVREGAGRAKIGSRLAPDSDEKAAGIFGQMTLPKS